MLRKILKRIINDKYWLLVILFFGIILLSRLLFLGADLPSTHVEIEEKPGGYSARNMILFNRWSLYQNWYQPMVYVPVQNLLSYLSFRFLGIGLAQFRFPMALASFFGLIFFFLILLKQTNRWFALLGLSLYAFGFEMTVWNRSGLSENLYFLFIPLSAYFLTKEKLSNKDFFFLVFFAALNVVVKLDGYSFFLTVALFTLIWSYKLRSWVKNTKFLILGLLAALAVLLALFVVFDAFKYVSSMYRFYFEIMGNQGPIFNGIFLTFKKLSSILLSIDPYILLALLISLPVLLVNRFRLNRIDWFMIAFLFIGTLSRLQVPADIIYWKRVMFLYFPFVYVIIRTLFLLFDRRDNLFEKERTPEKEFIGLIVSSGWSLATLAFYFAFFGQSIPRIYGFGEYRESFHYAKGTFTYLLLVILLAVGSFNYLLFFGRNQKVKNALAISILFLVLLSLSTNSFNVGKIFLPGNIRYSYQENIKYAKLIPEEEMIVSHEQGFRAFSYLSNHDFYFNHDGGTNPVSYREVFERKDLRYFILNIEEFFRGRWGLTNQDRLAFIKEAYPNLRLLGVFMASRVPLAIYDKYGNQ